MAWKIPMQWAVAIATALPAAALAQSSGFFYISGAVGVALPRDNHIKGFSCNSSRAGIRGLLSSGFTFKSGLRTELEAGYQDNVSTAAASLMSNVFYDFRGSSNFVPYIGAGVGGLWVHFAEGALATGTSNFTFAYQGIIGVDYTITETLHSFVDYRYSSMRGTGSSMQDGGTVHARYGTHGVMLGLRWSFMVSKALANTAYINKKNVTYKKGCTTYKFDTINSTLKAQPDCQVVPKATTSKQLIRLISL
ncbi:Outer membrane protein A precursor [invertebrate metagenome]|uniref:Outer membrane protein A n=1 Tax=invertebrate metagenome TaxID=1711999 RepID=A0A484H7U1_9ZZZZ